MSTTSRSRWAAIGAAVAVTLGAGGVGIGQATSDSADGPVSAFFPIEPCRLAENVSIGADASVVFDGWGETGECELPEGTTGLAVNVTAVDATEQTNVRFYAEGDPTPETANLNPTPGAPPIPNAVNAPLNTTNGQFRVYNRFGTVGVFIDVMGYYDDHTHDDRYYTKEEIDGQVDDAVAAVQPTVTDLSYTSSNVIATPTADFQLIQTIGTFEKLSADTTIRLDWSAHHSHGSPAGALYCHYQLRVDGATVAGNTALTAGTTLDGGDAVAENDYAQLATHAIFSGLDAGDRTVAVYVRGNASNCTLNPGTFVQQLTVTEFSQPAE